MKNKIRNKILILLIIIIGLTGCGKKTLSGTYIPTIEKENKNYAFTTPAVLLLADEGIEFNEDGSCNLIGRDSNCNYKHEKGKYKLTIKEVMGDLNLELKKADKENLKDNYNYSWSKLDEQPTTRAKINEDKIYRIDMQVNLNENGDADITEIWDVRAASGSEWYKQLYNMGNEKVSNFKVYMDDILLNNKEWNVNESMVQKSGYYGINTVSEGIELCFGKGDMNRHIFKLTYNLSNIIFNVSDAQVLYQTFLPKVFVDNFTVTINSFSSISSNLEIWKYGYEGYAYVKNGRIEMFNNDKPLYNEYAALLAKFPVDTFNTQNTHDKFKNFDSVLTDASGFKLILGITNE